LFNDLLHKLFAHIFTFQATVLTYYLNSAWYYLDQHSFTYEYY